MEIYIFFGPPGVGKGTQAKKFALKHEFKHISTGELLRQEMRADTELGRTAAQYINSGNLAPDNTVISIIDEQLRNFSDLPGFVFDGFPRTNAQAEALDQIVAREGKIIKAVFRLEAHEPELIQRLLKREKLEGRLDDTEETIKNRLDIYERLTKPVLDHYRAKGCLIEIDGEGTVEEIENRIEQAYTDLKK